MKNFLLIFMHTINFVVTIFLIHADMAVDEEPSGTLQLILVYIILLLLAPSQFEG